MKKSILSLVSLVVLGTGLMSAQTVSNPQDGKTDRPLPPPAENVDVPTNIPDFGDPRDMPFPPQDMKGSCDSNGKCKKGRSLKDGCHKKVHGMKKGHPKGKHDRVGGRQGHRPHMKPVQSTPKCKCPTCVELRKREDMMKQIETLQKEKQDLQQKIDSLHKDLFR